MLPLSYPRRWQLASLCLLLIVLFLAMAPGSWFSQWKPPGSFSLSDKWMHALTFAFLAIWFSGQYARSYYWKPVVGLVLFGAAIEIGQYFIPYRNAERLDMVADIAGIAGGLLVALLGVGGWSLAVEKRILERIE